MLIISLYLKERGEKKAHRIASNISLMWTPNPVRLHFKEKKQNKNYDTMYQMKITFSNFDHLHLVPHWLRVTIPHR